ncbi:MAG TPA: bifunctional DNA-formamidopyrimidine glycosylase/DNA-(apurinic or apyrimidinic site) lyase [Planctomycetaceae bacterium]|nr:bifunctional DNA-formamidopyrimidine glycosylase/DNA-(apurinic or apyrimidinic site) lyase [Planctomycetaceae bacterium]
MPELPEVETMVRGIRPFVEGRTVESVVRCRCSCKPISIRPRFELLAKRLVGRRIDSVRRLGKRVVLDVSDDSAVVIEPRMTGLMLLSDPPDRLHLRIEWKFSGRAKYNSIWFWDRRGLGTVRLFAPGELERTLSAEVLGPDALQMDAEAWRERCRKTSRPIKVLLLDQRTVAGIGNLYASEILHVAKIHPAKAAGRLKADEIRRLSDATRDVLEEAIRDEGSTLGDATYRTALNGSGRYQSKHRVYGRGDETCPTCLEAPIRRFVQAQRSTFFCPVCQRR